MSDRDSVKISTIAVQKFMLANQFAFRNENLNGIAGTLSAEVRHGLNRVIVGVRAYCLANIHEAKAKKIKRWASWHDHFRADVMPRWVNKKWPPRQEEETVFQPITVKICPHKEIPSDDMKHLYYIAHSVHDGGEI